VLSLIGQGGFGAVYKAQDVKLGRLTAIKFLREPLFEKHRKLFEREAKALASVSTHPGIVEIYAWGDHESSNYFALEYVASNAAQCLRENPEGLEASEALRIIQLSCEAVAHAHQQGILHRDIKPANILVDPETRAVKVADFGLAKYLHQGGTSVTAGASGSPLYMSPEQAAGEELDERTDVYSLGVSLYELLCGRAPFEAGSALGVLNEVRKGKAVPLRKHSPNLPKSVTRIVETAMAHSRHQRFANAQEMADAIAHARATFEKDTKDAMHGGACRQARRPLRVVLMAAAAMVAAGVFAVAFGLRGGGHEFGLDAALARAEDSLDERQFDDALQAFEAVLAEDPASDRARLGLAFTHLLAGDVDRAHAALDGIQDESLDWEGKAAVAYEQDGVASRPLLEEALSKGGGPYCATLLAAVANLEDQYGEALKRLKAVDVAALRYRWQQARYQHYVRQAQFHLGQAVDLSGESGVPMDPDSWLGFSMQSYDTMARAREDKERSARISEALRRVKAAMDADGGGAFALQDGWTSRPMVLCILPVEPGSSRFARESGLADVLPLALGDKLAKTPALDIVDRGLLGEALMEQELSASLGDPGKRLRLGRVLGARLLVSCRAEQLLGEDVIYTTLVDAETTQRYFVEEMVLERRTNPSQFFEELASGIRETVARSYPIRGKVAVGPDGPWLNIGRAVGVVEGQRFALLKRTEDSMGEPLGFAVVNDAIGEDSASVALEGITAEDFAGGELYAVALGASAEGGDA
jgi:tetratricopeptide (TPR) repeat protein